MEYKFESLQQIFDTVLAHSRKQPFQAVSEGGRCKYRTIIGGFSCFVGCLIPDDVYNAEMEGGSISTLLREYTGFKELFGPSLDYGLKELLLSLQSIHDTTPTESWEDKFHYIAVVYGLDYEALKGKPNEQ